MKRTNNWLGRSNWAADSYLNGYIDNFRVFQYALNSTQVAALAK